MSAANAAEEVSSTRAAAANLLLDCVGEVFDDCVREESFTHLPKLRFDVLPRLPTVRKRNFEQFSDAHIFHAVEAKRAERVLDRFPLRVEDGGLEVDGDESLHECNVKC